MKKFLGTIGLITALIMLLTACSFFEIAGGGSYRKSDDSVGDTMRIDGFVSEGSGLFVTKEGDGTVLSFYKSGGEKDYAAKADVGYRIDRYKYLGLSLKADSTLCIKVVLRYYGTADLSATAYAEGVILVYESERNYSLNVSTAASIGYGVLKSIEIYPSYGTTEGRNKLYIGGCYLCSEPANNSTAVDLKITVPPSPGYSGGHEADSSSASQASVSSAYYPTTSSSSVSYGQSSSAYQSSSSDQSSSSNEQAPMQVDYLWQKYASYFPIGYALGADHIDWYKGNLDKHYNSFTCENEMKLYSIAPNYLEQDNFGPSDNLIAYAKSQGKRVRGHALIWYNGAPSWLADCRDKNQLLSLIERYVTRVVNHYGNNVYCWDVVNEAVGDDNNYRSTFYDVAGLDFIKTAFRAARAANPNIKLFYNDYNMDKRGKRAKVIEMIKELQRDGVPIDGIGMQGHYNLKDTSVWDVENAINDFAALGLEVQITELDIKNYGNANPSGQADLYRRLFEVFRIHSDVITGVTFWNVADDYSWMDNMSEFSYYGTGKAYATIFDVNHNKKSAFDQIFNF